MGGGKKRSLAQIEKQQKVKGKEEVKAKEKKSKGSAEKKSGILNLPDTSSKEFLDELSKMRAITPYGLASKYGLKLSIAKDVLDDLEKRGTIQMVAGNNRLRIYMIAAG